MNKLGLDLQNVLPRVRYPVQMGQVINIIVHREFQPLLFHETLGKDSSCFSQQT